MATSPTMYLREHGRTKDGKEHAYWSLVGTARTPEGPSQRTLCYLGELNTTAQARWRKTIEVFNEQGESWQLKWGKRGERGQPELRGSSRNSACRSALSKAYATTKPMCAAGGCLPHRTWSAMRCGPEWCGGRPTTENRAVQADPIPSLGYFFPKPFLFLLEPLVLTAQPLDCLQQPLKLGLKNVRHEPAYRPASRKQASSSGRFHPAKQIAIFDLKNNSTCHRHL